MNGVYFFVVLTAVVVGLTLYWVLTKDNSTRKYQQSRKQLKDSTNKELFLSLNQTITIMGNAKDTKGGAVLLDRFGGEPVFIEGLTYWPPEMKGKWISAAGLLVRDETTQGIGTQFRLRNAKWRIEGTGIPLSGSQ